MATHFALFTVALLIAFAVTITASALPAPEEKPTPDSIPKAEKAVKEDLEKRRSAGGMKCVAVRCVGHHPEVALRQAGADLVVETLEQVSARIIQDLLSK